MIEALVSLRIGRADTALKKRGDILVVALTGSPWSQTELKTCALIEWQDSALEARLNAMKTKARPWPRISYPYATSVSESIKLKNGKTITRRRLTVRATDNGAIDIEKLPTQLKSDLLNSAKATTRIPLASITTKQTATRSLSPGI